MNKMLIPAALVATLCCGTAQAQPETRQLAVADYTVFVDPPSGFVFVKLPSGWTFAGKVQAKELQRLPGTVVTALLRPEAELADVAMREAGRTSH